MKHVIILIPEDRKGVIADISKRLGNEGINIESVSASVVGGQGIIIITVRASEYKKTLGILKEAGYHVITADVLMLELKDEPGVLAEVSQTLFNNDINIESIHLVTKYDDKAIYALKVDRTSEARRLLADYLLDNKL